MRDISKVENSTFKIEFVKNWINQNIEFITPKKYKGQRVEYLTIDEILEKYGDMITREELEELKRNK